MQIVQEYLRRQGRHKGYAGKKSMECPVTDL